jgi:uncharacterized OB-fold protein
MSTKKWWNPPAMGCVCERCGTVYFPFQWGPVFTCSRCESGRRNAVAFDKFKAVQRQLGAA